MASTADLGLVGLAVMGQNLALNLADHGLTVSVHNRTEKVTSDFVAGPGAGHAASGRLVPESSLDDLVERLERPRRILLMVKAGQVVDSVIDHLVLLLDEGDVIIDGGNSHFADTARRLDALADRGLLYVGSGVSGGEEGARNGPSIMPGGSPEARELVMPILEAIAARADDGTPCAAWLGPGGSGHFVKMVHNGIEYGDMQVLAEAYALLGAQGASNAEMGAVFERWRHGALSSYLVDITAEILTTVDDDGRTVVDLVLDAAGQKGTGRWTVSNSLELGQPLTLIAEAVMARQLSALVELRASASATLGGPDGTLDADAVAVADIEGAVYAAKIVSYAQGFMLLAEASQEHGWDLDLGTVASLWRAGCIIRAGFLDDITAAYRDGVSDANLLLAPFFAEALDATEGSLRQVVVAAATAGLALPACSSALAFYDGIRTRRGPANLIQAQRDYFGAHTYERVDRARGEFFHTDWTGEGGATTSTSYQA